MRLRPRSIFLVLIVVILSSGYVFNTHFKPPLAEETSLTDTEPTLSVTNETVIPNDTVYRVTYDGQVFTPITVIPYKNMAVTFVNISTSTELWVASDPHPLHTDIVGFDSERSLNPGESYTFTFPNTGTFSYHNHIAHLQHGFVHVISVDNSEDLPLSKTPVGLTQLRDKFLAMLKPNDPNSIFEVVDALQKDPELASDCHDIAHDVGHQAYDLYGFSEAMTFNNPHHVKHPLVQYICAGGYMHGIIEQLSLHQSAFLTQPDIICASVEADARDSCFHGVGHVFMLANERDPQQSIDGCRLVTNDTDMYRCFEGVRMEQFWGNTEYVGTTSLGWETNDPLSTCVVAKSDEKPTCFLYSTFGYLRIHPKDYLGAVHLCTESGLSENDAFFCLKGLGITMMSKFNGQHLEGSEKYMAGLSQTYKSAFYQGVLGYARLSGVQRGTLSTTCDLFLTDGDLCKEVLVTIK